MTKEETSPSSFAENASKSNIPDENAESQHKDKQSQDKDKESQSEPASEKKPGDKKKPKPKTRVKRPFGSIRCRSVSYNLT